jgi:hypothetical protein
VEACGAAATETQSTGAGASLASFSADLASDVGQLLLGAMLAAALGCAPSSFVAECKTQDGTTDGRMGTAASSPSLCSRVSGRLDLATGERRAPPSRAPAARGGLVETEQTSPCGRTQRGTPFRRRRRQLQAPSLRSLAGALWCSARCPLAGAPAPQALARGLPGDASSLAGHEPCWLVVPDSFSFSAQLPPSPSAGACATHC